MGNRSVASTMYHVRYPILHELKIKNAHVLSMFYQFAKAHDREDTKLATVVSGIIRQRAAPNWAF